MRWLVSLYRAAMRFCDDCIAQQRRYVERDRDA